MNNLILAIDTSCDETAATVVSGRKVLSNVIYSQILLHQKWGGVVPSLAKRAHQEKIDFVIQKALLKIGNSTKIFSQVNSADATLASNIHSRQNFVSLLVNNIDCIVVTQGPGLAPALEVGIKKAKELASKYNKKLIAVNHLEGHIYSPFVQNSAGNPKIDFQFPYLVLIVSGGHTSLVIFKDHLEYEVIGETIDDAAGEALDKAAKMLGLGYPGGPVIERLSNEVDNLDKYKFPRPMIRSEDLNFSFSGLKTSFYYYLKKLDDRIKILNLKYLVSAFQNAVFDTLIFKTEKAIKKTGIKKLCLVGGVSANLYLRRLFRQLAKKHYGEVLFPSYKYLTGDNAAMIGVVGYYKAIKGEYVKNIDDLDREPRMRL